MNPLFIFVFIFIYALACLPALALGKGDASSPAGLWRTVDDVTGKPKSLVRVWVEKDQLFGRVDSIFPVPGKTGEPLCGKCPGEFQDKPIRGIRFLWGLREKDGEWTGGRVLDPNNGKIYKCSLRLQEGGKSLAIRGYIGLSLLGRSQTWEREE